MAPGMRIAWLVMRDEEIREKVVLAKQGADLHSGTFAQYVFHQYVSSGDAFESHVRRIAETYARRREVMAEALAEFMPEGVRFTRPAGGMFLWVTVPGRRYDGAFEDLRRVESRLRSRREFLSRARRPRRHAFELLKCLREEYSYRRRTARPRNHSL